MIKRTIRPYEMSLWTLQDSFLTILKGIGINEKGQIESPKILIRNDGTLELNFSIPMYRQENGELIENPLWFDTKNGTLMVNLRKIKVIFNKGEQGEEVLEFVISKVTETHTDGKLICEVFAEGLAFQELGKIGYKISLNQDIFLLEYEDWWANKSSRAEPVATLNYWADKIFKNSNWSYSVQMDWSGYDGIIPKLGGKNYSELTKEEKEELNNSRVNAGYRRLDKVYEEEYIASWDVDEDKQTITPHETVAFEEKARMVEIEKSNIYNATQTLAETFGVYCKYKYHYDENYHIIGRECIFYNNFLDEQSGKIDINYPYHSSKISREIDSADIVTKMFVVPLDDDIGQEGSVTIATTSANRTREDYILNFDYLYMTGSISEEQYRDIEAYEYKIYTLNQELEPLAKQIAELQLDKVEYEAILKVAQESQTHAKEQMDQSTALMNSLTNGTNKLSYTTKNPYRAVLLQDTNGSYYLKISQGGVHSDTIKIYTKYELGESKELYNGDFSIVKDNEGNINRISGISAPTDDNRIYFLTFEYTPKLQYENVYNTYAQKLAKDIADATDAEKKLNAIISKLNQAQETYEELLEEKAKVVADFERMMGPAIKEGSWQADTYTDYGIKYDEEVGVGINNSESGNLAFIWDENRFEEEYSNSYLIGIPQVTKYYPAIDLSDHLDEIQDRLENLSYEYNYNGNHYLNIGSQMQYAFLKNDNKLIPVLLLTDIETKSDDEVEAIQRGGRLVVITSEMNNDGSLNVKTTELVSLVSFTLNNASTKIVYPRIEVKSNVLKNTEDELFVRINSSPPTVLKKFYDYYVLSRDESYFITIKPKIMLSQGNIEKNFNITYSLSNAAQALYFDALEVSKTNAFPQVSYTINVSALNESFIKFAYQKLNKVVNINDSDLKFENVQGYISELNLDLDNPWQDSIVIQNYKTKFEDLFSSIVASTEQMKTHSFSYNRAANAFTSNGTLKPSVIQNTLDQSYLSYAFQGGNLTIDEINGIWGVSDAGVVAMKGGGIFCATQQDSSGNWLWSTGITPEGINASLLRAGQIDTNLIRIYAGDNLRLQLNNQGLYAYQRAENGEANLNNYVVHNSEGLFLVNENVKLENEQVVDINRVSISWDGLQITNKSNEQVFYADEYGNLNIVGKITALAGGKIGGWEISEDSLFTTNGTQTTGMSSKSGTEDEVFWAKGKNGSFYVTADGTLTATNAIIKGTSQLGKIFVDDMNNAIIGLKITDFNGFVFKRTSDFNGGFTYDTEYLKFVMTDTGTEEGNYIFSISYDEGINWVSITESNSPLQKHFSFNLDNLTFLIKYGIMTYEGIEHSRAILKVEKGGYEASVAIYFLYDGKDGADGIEPKFIEINPVGYAFLPDENGSYDSQSTYVEVTLHGDLDSSKGTWQVNGNAMDGQEGRPNWNKLTSVLIEAKYYHDDDEIIVTYTNEVSRTCQIWKTKTGQNGKDGKDAVTVIIDSSNGTYFKGVNRSTILTAKVYVGGVLDTTNIYNYTWYKGNNELEEKSNTLEVNNLDLYAKAVYTCVVSSE